MSVTIEQLYNDDATAEWVELLNQNFTGTEWCTPGPLSSILAERLQAHLDTAPPAARLTPDYNYAQGVVDCTRI